MDYLRFDIQPKAKGKKTNVWLVVSTRSNSAIGRVCWWPAWRQYTFFPNRGTVWNPDCLRTVADFCERATKLRRERIAA